MTAILISLALLAILFWILLRLRKLREREVVVELPPDRATILVGLFYTLSRGCLAHFRDKYHYPRSVVGAPDSLLELGYLKGEPLAEITSSIKVFSIAISDRAGFGICLTHTPAVMANEIIGRVSENNGPGEFVEFKNGQFLPLTYPVTRNLINLTLPLPIQPMGTKPVVLESAEPKPSPAPIILDSGDEEDEETFEIEKEKEKETEKGRIRPRSKKS